MDGTTWAALTAALTVAGAIWTWLAFRRRGAASGMRALGVTLLPAAAWLTGTPRMFVEIAGSVGDWATGLVFDVFTWSGLALALLSVGLITLSRRLRDRASPRARAEVGTKGRSSRTSAASSPQVAGSARRPSIDDEMDDEIAALLKKRGIE